MAPKGKSKVSKALIPSQPEKEPAQLPNWPPLVPVVPTDNLSAETILDDQILVIRNLFTSKLCSSYISYLSTLPLTTTSGKPKKGEAVRVNDRFQVEDLLFANLLWETTALRELVSNDSKDKWGGEVLGLNPNIRVYRYRPGHCFHRHYDESNRIFFGPHKIPAKTTWTLLIYLSTCGGGETVFYPEGSGQKGEKTPDPVSIEPEASTVLLAGSHVEYKARKGLWGFRVDSKRLSVKNLNEQWPGGETGSFDKGRQSQTLVGND